MEGNLEDIHIKFSAFIDFILQNVFVAFLDILLDSRHSDKHAT